MPRSSAAVIALRKAMCADLEKTLDALGNLPHNRLYDEANRDDVTEAVRIVRNALKRTHG